MATEQKNSPSHHSEREAVAQQIHYEMGCTITAARICADRALIAAEQVRVQADSQRGDNIELQEAEQRGFERGVKHAEQVRHSLSESDLANIMQNHIHACAANNLYGFSDAARAIIAAGQVRTSEGKIDEKEIAKLACCGASGCIAGEARCAFRDYLPNVRAIIQHLQSDSSGQKSNFEPS